MTVIREIGSKVREIAYRTGFSFSETMQGDFIFLDSDRIDEGKKDISFSISAKSPSVARFFAPVGSDPLSRMIEIEGTITAQDLATSATIENGTLRADITGEKKLRYHFLFVGDDGRRYRFVGVKNLSVFSPWKSATTLDIKIYPTDSADPIASGVMYFDAAQLLPFLRSWKIANG